MRLVSLIVLNGFKTAYSDSLMATIVASPLIMLFSFCLLDKPSLMDQILCVLPWWENPINQTFGLNIQTIE